MQLFEELAQNMKNAFSRTPLSVWDHFDKIDQIGLKPALVEKRRLEAISMNCKFSLA